MLHLTHLCEDIGARLTGSSAAEEANIWTRDQFASWGLDNAHLHEWGEIGLRFDRLPSSARVLVEQERTNDDDETITEDRELREMEFTWLAWSKGTDGPVRGPAVPMPRTIEELEQVEDRLEGAWVLVRPDYSGRRGIRGIGRSMGARAEYHRDLRERAAAGEFGTPPEPVLAEAAEDDGFSGTWEGTITGPMAPDGAPFTIDANREEDGTIAGEAGIPGFRISTMKDPILDDGTFTFLWDSSQGDAPVTLMVAGDRMTGNLPGPDGGEGYELELRRDAPDTELVDADPTDYITARVLMAGPVGFISSSKDERVWTTRARGWRELTIDAMAPDPEISVRESDFDFIAARVAEGVPVMVECDLACELEDGPIPVYNTIAEITGTTKPDEVIIVSAHLDSWDGPGSQGTIDNGTGSAVTLEADRRMGHDTFLC